MKSQLQKMLIRFEVMMIAMATRVLPMPSRNCLKEAKIMKGMTETEM